MRKTFTLLSALVVAVSASALTPQQRPLVGGMIGGNMLLTSDAGELGKTDGQPRRFTTRSDNDALISERPEGTTKIYARSGDAYLAFFGGIVPETQDGKSLETVVAPDGQTIYFKNILSTNPTDTYVEGSIDGDKVSIPSGQMIAWDDEMDYGVVVAVGELYSYEEDGKTYLGYKESETKTSIDFTVGSDGVMRLDPDFKIPTDGTYPQFVVTGFWSDDNQWVGDSDWNTIYIPFNEEVALFPDVIEISDYSLRHVDPDPYYGGELTFELLKGGIKDGKFYLAGLNPSAPDAVWVGDISATTGVEGTTFVTFPANQYMGIAEERFAYTLGGTYSYHTEYDPNYQQEITTLEFTPVGDLTFIFNSDEGSLTPAEEQSWLALNSGRWTEGDEMREIVIYADPKISPYAEKTATPATPVIQDVGDYYEMGGYIGLNCFIPTEDVEGGYIDPDKLYYIIYVDSEDNPYVFTADEYPNVASLDGAESIIEVPYNFESTDANGYEGILPEANQVYLNIPLPERLGLRSVYYGGDVRTVSDIFWYGDESSVSEIRTNGSEQIYGIDGTIRQRMERGVNLLRKSDGSVRKVMVP